MAVSPRSELVMPKCTQRLGLGVPSGTCASMYFAMTVVNAMTSWFVTFSTSSISGTVKSACARIHAASSFVIPMRPSSACASQASTSISFHTSNLFSSDQICPI